MEKAGGRAKLLPVGGGFHSPYMEEASQAFLRVLQENGSRSPEIPVYANRNGQPYGTSLEELLAAQMAHPVRWQDTLEQMAADGFTHFVEVGPGKTLSGFVKRTLPQAVCLHVEDADSLAQTVEALLPSFSSLSLHSHKTAQEELSI